MARIEPGLDIRYHWVESEADRNLDATLADAGGKGLFVKAIEQAVVRHEADVAVHSLKDLPALPASPGLVIAAVPLRQDVRDCLISAVVTSLDQLPHGAVVGTASPRRAAQVRRLRPDLRIQPLRGNIQTRISKVLAEDGAYDATLLAVAGLRRGGLSVHAKHPVELATMLTAAGQGALAVQCRADDHLTVARCLPLNDPISAVAVHAERQVVAALGGDCHSSIAVLAQPVGPASIGGEFRLRARVLSPDGQVCLEADRTGPTRQLGRVAKQVVAQLRESGADALLR